MRQYWRLARRMLEPERRFCDRAALLDFLDRSIVRSTVSGYLSDDSFIHLGRLLLYLVVVQHACHVIGIIRLSFHHSYDVYM